MQNPYEFDIEKIVQSNIILKRKGDILNNNKTKISKISKISKIIIVMDNLDLFDKDKHASKKRKLS